MKRLVPSYVVILCLTILIASSLLMTVEISLASPLDIIVETDKQTYTIRETVNISGNLTLDGQPKEGGIVAVEVQDSLGHSLTCHSIPTGTISPTNLPIEILEVQTCDAPPTLNPKDEFVIGTTAYIKVTVKNNENVAHYVVTALTTLDKTLVPIMFTDFSAFTLDPSASATLIGSVEIRKWASIGNATMFANAFTNHPDMGGVPCCLEKQSTFKILRMEETTSYAQMDATSQTAQEILDANGSFNSMFTLPPYAPPGNFTVHANGRYSTLTAEQDASFKVLSTPSPPQAAFIYYPLEAYVNMEITFDASSSSAEGFEDVIIRYEWDFGDGTPKVVKEGTVENPPSPKETHSFTEIGTYTVTLNVTDSQELWCATLKPIQILPPTGPTADFMWTPAYPYPNQTVTFDASSSKLGWNGTAHPPIISYEWNFGDGNRTTVTSATVHHVYETEGNYTVTLNITDAEGLQDIKSQNVTVTAAPPLVGDVNGDGVVNMRDVGLACQAFGSGPEDPEWNPNADVNGDDIINMRDIGIICSHFGEHI